MLCQDNYTNWATTSFSLSETNETKIDNLQFDEPEKMQFSEVNCSSASNSNVKVLGIKLRIDEDTMSNLQSFYQNNIVQHEFNPKMTKPHKKQRVAHYEHLFGKYNIINHILKIYNFFIFLLEKKAEKKLLSAANSNDYKGVYRLLNMRVNVNACDNRKRTALHFAACHGNFDIGMENS